MSDISNNRLSPQKVDFSIREWRCPNGVSDETWRCIFELAHKVTDDYHEIGEAIQRQKARCDKYSRGSTKGCWVHDGEPKEPSVLWQEAMMNSLMYVARCKEVFVMSTIDSMVMMAKCMKRRVTADVRNTKRVEPY